MGKLLLLIAIPVAVVALFGQFSVVLSVFVAVVLLSYL